jgi:hypothetical protein
MSFYKCLGVDVVLKSVHCDSHLFFEIDKLDGNDEGTQTYNS